MMESQGAGVALRVIGAFCAVAGAVLHLILVPDHLKEMPYIGILFAIGSVALLLSAAGLALRNAFLAWTLGALVSGGMIVGFLLSRTVGLPGYHEKGWDAPYGPLSLVVEAGFILAFMAWAGRHVSKARPGSRAGAPPRAGGARSPATRAATDRR